MNKRGGSPATFAGKLASEKDANNPAKIIKLRLIAIFVFCKWSCELYLCLDFYTCCLKCLLCDLLNQTKPRLTRLVDFYVEVNHFKPKLTALITS